MFNMLNTTTRKTCKFKVYTVLIAHRTVLKTNLWLNLKRLTI